MRHRSLVCCFILALAMFASTGHARWWTKLLEVGEDAAKLGGKASSVAGRSAVRALRSRPSTLGAARALEITDREVRAVDATGGAVAVAGIGAAGTLATLTPEGAELLKQVAIVVSEGDVGTLRSLLTDAIKASGRPASVIFENGSIGRLVVGSTSKGESLLMEVYPGVFLDAAVSDIRWALDQAFRKDRIRVVSLLDVSDADELARLDHAVGEIHLPAGTHSAESTVRLVRSQRESTIFVVGHVEGDRFVVRDAAGAFKKAVEFSTLEDAAKKADATLFLLGCSAAECATTSAFIGPVNAEHVARALKDAISQDTIGGALSALSSAGDLRVAPQLTDSVRILLAAEERASALDRKVAGAYRVLRLGTIARERAKELSDRIIPGIPSWVQMPYLAGAVLLLFAGRSVVAEWSQFRPPAPAFTRRPVAHVVVKGVRLLGFLILMPLALIFNLVFVGGTWAMGIVVPAMTLGLPVLIPAYYGWRLSRSFLTPENEDHWTVKYIGVPVFIFATSLIVTLVVSPIEQFRGVEHAGIEMRVIYWAVTGALGLMASLFAFRFLTRKHWNWGPSDIPALAIAAPLLLIEWVASLELHRPGHGHD